MDKLFKKVKKSFPEASVQAEKNYVSFSFGGAFYYQLRVQKDKVRMMLTNYPAKAALTDCLKLIKTNNLDGAIVNGKTLIFEEGARNPEIFTIRLEMPYSSAAQLDKKVFIDDVIDSCVKFHDALLPLVNHFMENPVGDLYTMMGGVTTVDNSNQPDVSGDLKTAFPAMIAAYESGNIEKVSELILQGNPPLQFNQDGSVIENELIAYCAGQEIEIEVLQQIIKRSGDLNVRNIDADQYTAVHYCAWDGKTDALDLLLKSGADADIVGADGRTALHLATAMGHTSAISILLQAGVDIERLIPDSNKYYCKQGATALREALINQRWEIVDLLLDAGAETTMLTEPCVESYKDEKDLFAVIRLLAEDGEYSDGNFDEDKLTELEKRVKNVNSEIQEGEYDEESVSESEDNEQGFPVITYRIPSQDLIDVYKAFFKKWQKPSDLYAWRGGISAYVPECVQELVSDDVCPVFSNEQIDTIYNKIHDGKVIPILNYAPYELFNHTKRVWWIVPFCIIKEDVASMVFVDKDGFYTLIDNEGEVDFKMIFPWDKVDYLNFESTADDDPNVCRLTLHQENGGYLTFEEFISETEDDNHGSYLKIIEAIWEVRRETIEASRGKSIWLEGEGGETFEVYEHPSDLYKEKNEKPENNSNGSSENEEEFLDNESRQEKDSAEFFIGKEYELEYSRFIEIAEKTGIVLNDIIIEPDEKERNELWEIARKFADRIYEIDNEERPDVFELNTLCFFSIVALHWCDLMVFDKEFSYNNGRFRRDTIALALCFYARIERSYKFYGHVKMQFILPHLQFSVLLWTINAIVGYGEDKFFGKFSSKDAISASRLFLQLDEENKQSGGHGLVSPDKMPEEHPLKLIWEEIFNRFKGSRIPYQFIRNYIGLSEGSHSSSEKKMSKSDSANPNVFVALLQEDKDKNSVYLDKILKTRDFPADWSFVDDIAFLSIYFVSKTDNEIKSEEIDLIIEQIGEWMGAYDQDEQLSLATATYDKAKELFAKDASDDRFNFVLESIRRHISLKNENEADKTEKQLKIILNDLLSLAETDSILTEEVDLIISIRDIWGIKWGDNDDGSSNEVASEDNADVNDEHEMPEIDETVNLESKLEEFYCMNVWEREGYGLDKKPFPNVASSKQELDLLFRKFTQEEINLIVKKIKETKTYFFLPFIRELLRREIDLSGIKAPFWFIPVVGYGNDITSILYFTQDGIYNTFNNNISLSLAAHVDTWKDLSVEPGYNGLFNDKSDDDTLSSLKINWFNPQSGNSGAINMVEFHGEDYGVTLEIVKAIWDYVWKDVVEKSRNLPQFHLGPPPFLESFESWDDLLEWAKS